MQPDLVRRTGDQHPEDVMSYIRHLFGILFGAAVVFVALDDESRTRTSILFQSGYDLVIGRNTPIPLHRPPFLAPAALHDCLRGTGEIADDTTFAEFCADLATFASTEPYETKVAEGSSDPDASFAADGYAVPLPVENPATARASREDTRTIAKAASCMIDASGAAATRADGIWVRAVPRQISGASAGEKSDDTARLFAVPAGCDVQSPAKALVLFAGTFKGYLGVVILDTGNVDRLTVAGLGNVVVRRGDRIARGTIIGSTSQAAAPALASATENGGAALLYLGRMGETLGELAAAGGPPA